jgi:hypothetical protein
MIIAIEELQPFQSPAGIRGHPNGLCMKHGTTKKKRFNPNIEASYIV